MITSRRSFITGLAALIAAPAVVRYASLMPVKAMPSVEDLNALLKARMDEAYRITRENMANSLYGNLTDMTRAAFVPRLQVQVYDCWPIAEWSIPVALDSPSK